ncbi:MAG: metallophosphoesterase family protein [Muribaculaceae bacterium]|nr:metallophosphoesterase family protein [Muribaculaceae bacterium]
MTILHISDTHNQHRSLVNLPEADIIVHSGDFCFAGTEDEAFDFMNWFCDLPYKHKVFVAGNHDDCMYGANIIEGLDANCHYLCNSSVIIERVKFYGIPLFMEDVSDGKTDRQIARIPHDTEVLITHNPPYNILDCSKNIHYGDWLLPEVIKQRDNLRVHLFGHIHDAAGTITQEGVVYSNASLVDENYNKQEQEYHVIQLKHPSQG